MPKETTEKAPSKTWVKLEADYKKDPKRVLRVCNDISYVRRLIKEPNLTWEQFCALKLKVLTEYWTNVSKNPSLLTGQGFRAPKPEDEGKIKKRLEKAKAELEKAQKQLDLLDEVKKAKK